MKKYQNSLPHTETKDSGTSNISTYFHTLGGLKAQGCAEGNGEFPFALLLHANVN